MATKKKAAKSIARGSVKSGATALLMAGSGGKKSRSGDNLGSTRPGRNMDRYLEEATGEGRRKR